jgi:hypothetical protein
MRKLVSVGVISLVVLLASCGMNFQAQQPAQAPAPCRPPVDPIRNDSDLVVSVQTNFTYTPKDQAVVQSTVPELVLAELNRQGREDGNVWELQNGQQKNFSLRFVFNNNSEQYTGSVEVAGWGVGHITNISTPYPFHDASEMLIYLTDQAYTFPHQGWHDLRPSCPQP